MVRQSYREAWTFPGGGPQIGENARAAACRELTEEVGLRVEPDRLTLAHTSLHDWEYRHDHVRIFSLHVAQKPSLTVDGREIIEACFRDPEAVLRTPIPPHVRSYLESARLPPPPRRSVDGE